LIDRHCTRSKRWATLAQLIISVDFAYFVHLFLQQHICSGPCHHPMRIVFLHPVSDMTLSGVVPVCLLRVIRIGSLLTSPAFFGPPLFCAREEFFLDLPP
jgi:hypothetical protein